LKNRFSDKQLLKGKKVVAQKPETCLYNEEIGVVFELNKLIYLFFILRT